MSSEVEVRKISMKTLITGIILVIIVSFLTISTYNLVGLPSWEGSTYGRSPRWSPYTYLWTKTFTALNVATFFIFIITVINMIKPIFKKPEIAIIVVMLMLAACLSSYGTYSETLNFFYTYGWGLYSPTRCPPEEDVARIEMFMADIMGCGKDKDYWQMVMSTWWSPIRWDYIMPMIVWGGFLTSMLCLVGIFIALLTRRLYVDVEALYFPFASLTNEMINASQPTEEGKLGFFNKYFLIGFLIQFLWILIGNLPWNLWMFVAYGETAPWGTARGRFGDFHIFPVYDATQHAILPWVCLNIFLDPWIIGWGVLLPLEVIIGCLLGWFVIRVLVPVILTGMGIWPEFPTGYWGYMPAYRINWANWAGGTANVTWFMFGMTIAFAVLPIVRNLGTMGPIFAAITGKEPPEDVDPEKPLPYKIVWWGFIASMILYAVTSAAADVMPQYTFVFVVLMALILFGGFRFVAETGGYMGWNYMHPFHCAAGPQWITTIILATMGAGIIGVESRTTLMTYAFIAYGLNSLFYSTAHGAGYLTLEGFKLGKLTGVSLKDISKAAFITVILTMFVAAFGSFFWQSVFPADKRAGAIYNWLGAGLFFNIYQKNIAEGVPYWMDRGPYLGLIEEPGPYDCLLKAAIGVVVVVGLTFARERFPWLRISAAGILLGALGGMKFWAPFIVAVVIKYVTLKVGGIRLYEEKVKPLMVGFLYGFFLAFMINWLTFVPPWIRGYYGLI